MKDAVRIIIRWQVAITSDLTDFTAAGADRFLTWFTTRSKTMFSMGSDWLTNGGIPNFYAGVEKDEGDDGARTGSAVAMQSRAEGKYRKVSRS